MPGTTAPGGRNPYSGDCETVSKIGTFLRFRKRTAGARIVPNIIWLASYPRSGNTFIRVLLRHCLGLRSGSFYHNDLGGRKPLEDAVGHVEHITPGKLRFEPGEPHLVKTHKPCGDNRRAIYVVRDGRAATVSLWKFFDGRYSLRQVVEGKTEFGLWQDHVESWNPLHRPHTLVLRYEDLLTNPLAAVEAMSRFLDRPIVSRTIPSRESFTAIDAKWITAGTDWRELLSGELERRCVELNHRQLAALGYVSVEACAAAQG